MDALPLFLDRCSRNELLMRSRKASRPPPSPGGFELDIFFLLAVGDASVGLRVGGGDGGLSDMLG